MPKVLGLNLVGVLVASVAFFLLGWLWYGMVFSDAYMAELGIPASAAEEGNPMTYILGFIITVLQVVGIGLAMKWKDAAGLGGAVTTAVILWIVFAVPFSAYSYLYGAAHSETLFMIDAGHLLVGWVISAIVLSLIK